MTFKKKLENVTVEEQSAVRLEVELSKSSDEVRWMRNSVVLQPTGNLQIQVAGAKQALVFKSVTQADQGSYSCETLDDKTQCKLNVESKSQFYQCLIYNMKYPLFFPSHITNSCMSRLRALIPTAVKKIQVVKKFTETKAHETETVTLEVELNQADVEGTWTRDGHRLKSVGSCRITALGKKHSLTLSSLKMEDAGTVAFQAEGVHVSAKLIVTGEISTSSAGQIVTP